MPALWLAVAAILLLGGCAREVGEARAPFPTAQGWVLPPGEYVWRPNSLPERLEARIDRAPPRPSSLRFAAASGVPTYADGRPRPQPPAAVAAVIPPGNACLEQLERSGVPYELMTQKVGVDTPVALRGPIGGIRYHAVGHELIADCRLLLALHQIGPELRQLGVESVRFSGAYSYRMSRVGRLSLHAYGLALDIHAVTAAGVTYEVARHFARGAANSCAADAPLLNRLSCRLARLRLFQELLTPDSNADHRDHLHIALARAPRTDWTGFSAAEHSAAR